MSEMFECSSLALYERFERKHKYNIVVFKMLHQELQKYSRILHFSKSTEVLKLNNKSLHYAIISWPRSCWNSKIQYSNEHSKTRDCKNYNKKFLKMIDVVNVVDIIVYQYWDNKIRVCRALSKTSGNPVTKPKEKIKRTW